MPQRVTIKPSCPYPELLGLTGLVMGTVNPTDPDNTDVQLKVEAKEGTMVVTLEKKHLILHQSRRGGRYHLDDSDFDIPKRVGSSHRGRRNRRR